MSQFVIFAFLMLFFKTNLRLLDESFLYLMTNLIGGVMLLVVSKKESQTPSVFRQKGIILYIVANLCLFLLTIVQIESIPIVADAISDYILALGYLVLTLFVYAYPLYLCLKQLKMIKKDSESRSISMGHSLITVAIALIPITIGLFFLAPAFSQIGIGTILMLELASMFFLYTDKNLLRINK
ncbi:hypothetical protein [Marinilactibacillus kalidii]|uniref:hypothetical protein n=1 Tax=Marinilactibacillus kalidii TaxID=2820274 RepID=UPI001ABEC6BF|nr:hypothetical protein [Marinilactibacillus kalidii]